MNPKDFDIGVLRPIMHTNNAFFWILAILAIICIIVARVNNRTYINGLFNFNQNFNQKLMSQQNLSSVLLVINYFIALTLFLVIFWQAINNSQSSLSPSTISSILLGLCVYYVLKMGIQLLLANLFSRQDHFDIKYTTRKYHILGLVLLPISVFSLYQSSNFQYYASIIGLIFIVIISVFTSYISFQQSRQLKISLFYIILYLCTLEILPLLLIAKYML